MLESIRKMILRAAEYLAHAPRSCQMGEDDVAFLEQLQAEVETPLEGSPDLARKRWETFRERSKGKRLTKADLYEMDRLALEMASPEELRAEAPGLYRRYCEETGDPIDLSDLAMKRLTPGKPETDEEITLLRARLLQVLRTLHWSYTFGPLREKRRVQLIERGMWLILTATLALAGIVVLLNTIYRGQHPFYAVIATVVYAGVMGGAVSCARRLAGVPTRSDALGSIYALENSRYVLYFAPLTGAVFAVITMLLFVGGVLSGIIFPTFATASAALTSSGPWPFTTFLLPQASKDYALLFLWCFISGFAERFIPDTLDQLTQRATTKVAALTGPVLQPAGIEQGRSEKQATKPESRPAAA